MFGRKIKEFFQFLEDFKEKLEKDLLQLRSELSEKIDELKSLIEKTEQKEKKVYLVIDGPNILTTFEKAEIELDWKALVEGIRQIFPNMKIKAIFWSYGLSYELIREISRAGIDIILCSWEYGKEVIDEKMLKYVAEEVPTNSCVIPFTLDEALKIQIANICIQKGVEVKLLAIDLYKQEIKDTSKGIVIHLLSSAEKALSSAEKAIEKVLWKEAINRLKTGNLDPQKFEIDLVLLEILKFIRHALPIIPKRMSVLIYPREPYQLADDIKSALNGLEFERPLENPLTTRDILGILREFSRIGLIKKIGVKNRIFYIRNKNWPESVTKLLK